MSLLTTYSILFEVKMLHHYFLNKGPVHYDKMTREEQAKMMLMYDAGAIFDISPTPECQKILRAHQCIFKRASAGILVGIKSEADPDDREKFKPFHNLDSNTEFHFLVSLNDPGFLNYTALPVRGNENSCYLFRNTPSKNRRQYPSLSSWAPTFEPDREYLPGDMLSDAVNPPSKLFTARLKTTKNTSISTDWLTEKKSDGFPLSYANVSDRVQLVRGLLVYKVKTAGVKPSATVTTAAGIEVTPEVTLLTGDFHSLQVDLRGYPDGMYSMHVQNNDLSYQDDVVFFLLQQKESPFAILSLAVESDVSEYNMLDAENYLNNRVYEVRFRNRSTHWRYIGKKFNSASVTAAPLPLTKYGVIENVSVKDKDGNNADDLPNPSVNMIRTEAMTDASEKKFYSEVHIH